MIDVREIKVKKRMKSKKSGTPRDRSGGFEKWGGAAASILLPFIFSEAEAGTPRPRHISRHARARTSGARLPRGAYPVPFIFIGGGGRGNVPHISSRPRWNPYAQEVTPPDIRWRPYLQKVAPPCYWDPYQQKVVFNSGWGYPYQSSPPPVTMSRPPSAEEILQEAKERRAASKQRIAEHKAKVGELKERSAERRAKQGLMELNLFMYYFDYVGENYIIAPMNIDAWTVALFAYSQEHPNEVVAWYDKNLMNRLSNEKRLYQIKCDKFQQKLGELGADVNTRLDEITETGASGIITRLEERRVRLGRPLTTPVIDSVAFLEELEKSRPYILGPGYKPKG